MMTMPTTNVASNFFRKSPNAVDTQKALAKAMGPRFGKPFSFGIAMKISYSTQTALPWIKSPREATCTSHAQSLARRPDKRSRMPKSAKRRNRRGLMSQNERAKKRSKHVRLAHCQLFEKKTRQNGKTPIVRDPVFGRQQNQRAHRLL